MRAVYVVAATDLMVTKIRVARALRKLESIIKNLAGEESKILLRLKECATKRLKDPVGWVEQVFSNLKKNLDEEVESACVSLSGGIDSLATTLILLSIGIRPITVTVNPGPIILPSKQISIIEKACKAVKVKNVFINPVDAQEFAENIKLALSGLRHPCKKCSEIIKKSVVEWAKDKGFKVVFFGSLLPTGGFSIDDSRDEVLVIHLPAMLALTKGLTSYITRSVLGNLKPYPYGCPLLTECNRRYKSMKLVSIKRLLKKVRAGVIEPAEALKKLKFILYA